MEVVYTKKNNTIPEKVTARQFKLAILQHILPNGKSLYDMVTFAISSIEDEDSKKAFLIEWESAPHFERYSPSIINMCNKIGIKSFELDEIFKKAETL